MYLIHEIDMQPFCFFVFLTDADSLMRYVKSVLLNLKSIATTVNKTYIVKNSFINEVGNPDD